jgi:hypothetical protein
MAGKKLAKLMDVFEQLPDGYLQCKNCVYSTPHPNRARAHAQVEHLVEFEPVVVKLETKGEPKEEFKFEEG